MPLAKKTAYDVQTLQASTTTAAGAVSANSSTIRLPPNINAAAFVLDITNAATDVGDTLDVFVQTKTDGTNWVDVVHFTQVLGNGSNTLRYISKVTAALATTEFENGTALGAAAVRNFIGDEWRARWVQVDGDSNGTFTFSVTAIPM